MGTIFVDNLEPQSGTTLTLGASGDAINLASGATAGFGKIGQVVQGTLTSTFSSSNEANSPVDLGLSATITPSSTSSKILCLVHIGLVSHSADTTWSFFLLRGSTNIGIGDASGIRIRANAGAGLQYNTSGWAGQNMAFNWLDSPATTSATTYKIQTGGNGVATVYINRSARDQNTLNDEDLRTASTITLMEVLA